LRHIYWNEDQKKTIRSVGKSGSIRLVWDQEIEGSNPSIPTNRALAIVQWIVHRASTSRMWVRFLLAGPIKICGYDVMVTYNFAKVNLRVRFSLPAPTSLC
jgi:hypothetical protein